MTDRFGMSCNLTLTSSCFVWLPRKGILSSTVLCKKKFVFLTSPNTPKMGEEEVSSRTIAYAPWPPARRSTLRTALRFLRLFSCPLMMMSCLVNPIPARSVNDFWPLLSQCPLRRFQWRICRPKGLKLQSWSWVVWNHPKLGGWLATVCQSHAWDVCFWQRFALLSQFSTFFSLYCSLLSCQWNIPS